MGLVVALRRRSWPALPLALCAACGAGGAATADGPPTATQGPTATHAPDGPPPRRADRPSTSSRAAPVATATCDRIIGVLTTREVRAEDRRARTGGSAYRVVLGVVSVPPADRPHVVAQRNPPWSHWSKAGLVVRDDAPPVTVRVPRAWRGRAAIGWGATSIAHTVRIASCPSRGAWRAYAGGFYLRSRSACVPLVVSVGGRSTTVGFGIGRRCSRPAPGRRP